MAFLSFLAALVPSVSAAGIEQIGAGSPGIDQMWGTIRQTFPFTDVGGGGVVFISMKITSIILSTLSAVAVIMIIYGGVKMITSGSDEGFAEAKKIVIYTSVGLILAMLADGVILYAISLLEQVAGS